MVSSSKTIGTIGTHEVSSESVTVTISYRAKSGKLTFVTPGENTEGRGPKIHETQNSVHAAFIDAGPYGFSTLKPVIR